MERGSYPACWVAPRTSLLQSSDPPTSARSSTATTWCCCTKHATGRAVGEDRVARGVDGTSTSGLPLWHVTLTVAGEAVTAAELRSGLERLVEERPFMLAVKYSSDRAE